MTTKRLIIQKAIELFNEKGVKNVTLREVAKDINKSYGNITYHFSTKEQLLEAIFEEYNQSLVALQTPEIVIENILHYFLIIPELNFDITVNYLFFFVDYTELKRTYQKLMIQVERKNNERAQKWKALLIKLQQENFLSSDLAEHDLHFIMELSTGLRMFYFQENPLKSLSKSKYTYKLNRLLLPYLSAEGKAFYHSYYADTAHDS
jgi:AcrR family transcriptional regulator